MYRLLVKISESIVGVDLLWSIIAPFSKLFGLLAIKREHVERRRIISGSGANRALSDLVVLNGPFKGLKYPKLRAIGGLPYAKLLGSYEAELHPILEEILKEDYADIIDIGCAEGYYAVGLAKAFPKSKVIAYDIDQSARELCRLMANTNAADNVEIRNFCSPEELKSLSFSGRSLIISDCESYEKELFTDEVIKSLSKSDILIETHDFMDIEISQILEERLTKTHKLQRIQSLDDIQKAYHYNYPQTEGLSLEQKRALFAESRPSTMDWLWCRAIT